MSDQVTKEFGAKVPMEEYDIFRKNFPQYGATNWFINASLAEFNRRCEQSPELAEQLVNQSIARMLQDNRETRRGAEGEDKFADFVPDEVNNGIPPEVYRQRHD